MKHVHIAIVAVTVGVVAMGLVGRYADQVRTAVSSSLSRTFCAAPIGAEIRTIKQALLNSQKQLDAIEIRLKILSTMQDQLLRDMVAIDLAIMDCEAGRPTCLYPTPEKLAEARERLATARHIYSVNGAEEDVLENLSVDLLQFQGRLSDRLRVLERMCMMRMV